MQANEKNLAIPISDDPKKEKDKPAPPEHQPIREPEVSPDVAPQVPNKDLPGKEDIPPIKAFIARTELGYW